MCLHYHLLNVYRGGGYFGQYCMWIYLPDLESLTFSIPIFRPITHPSVYYFQQKSTQICSNLVLFTTICSKSPNLWNMGSCVSDENPPIAVPNFMKKHLKRQAHTCIPCQCEAPSLSVWSYWLNWFNTHPCTEPVILISQWNNSSIYTHIVYKFSF